MNAVMEYTVVNKYATTPMVPTTVSATKAIHSTMMRIPVKVGLINIIIVCVTTIKPVGNM